MKHAPHYQKTPAKPLTAAHPPGSAAEDLVCQLKSIGKLAVSRKEAQQLLPYSARTFRRFEQRNMLPRLKATRKVVYAVSDLINLIREGK